MAIAKTREIRVPELSNIQSRDGLRAFITELHRYLKEYALRQERFSQEVVNALTPLTWAAPIAAAATIEPLQPLQPITGTAEIETIAAGPGANRFILLAQDGFTLTTGGNIASALEVGIGAAVELNLNFEDNLWYPHGTSGKIFATATSLVNAVRIGGATEDKQWAIYWDPTDGLIMESVLPAHSRQRIQVDKTWGIYDVEQAQDIAVVDPDNPSGANAGFALMAKEVGADPTGNPPSGWRYLYPKSDGWYEKDSAGVVTKVTN